MVYTDTYIKKQSKVCNTTMKIESDPLYVSSVYSSHHTVIIKHV